MEKKKSYQELLKEYTMTQNQKKAKELEGFTDLFLKVILQKRRVNQLREQIDVALDDRDKKTFMELSGELRKLMKELA